MIAALGTLPFLGTLWLLIVLGGRILEEDGGKILAALKGVQTQVPSERPVHARLRTRAALRPLRPANVEWRAAA